MSGYRSLHREQALGVGGGDGGGGAVWDVEASPLLVSSSSSSSVAAAAASSSRGRTDTHSSCWRIWAACSDGSVRSCVVQEKSLEGDGDSRQSDDELDASALNLHCTHVLTTRATTGGGGTSTGSVSGSVALGCTRVSLARNYVGDDNSAGDLIVLSMDLAGRVGVWSFGEAFDENLAPEKLGSTISDKGNEPPADQPRRIKPKIEFAVEDATGTTAAVCPPRVSGVGDVRVAVGRLDGTVAEVATGLITPTSKKDSFPPGTVLGVWGSRGSAVPLSLCWHPKMSTGCRTLAVGRQDGVVDVLTESRKKQHRIQSRHRTPVRAVAYTDDGHLLVTGSDEGLLCVWDVSRSSNSDSSSSSPPALVHHVLHAHRSWILRVSVLDDSRRFVTTGADKRLHVWNVEQMNQQAATHTFQTDQPAWSITRGPASRLVTGSDSGWLQVFSLE